VKEEIALKEKIRLLEKEIDTLADTMEAMTKNLREIDDLRNEIKGLKLFFARVHPEFKSKFPEIMQKVYKKKQAI
jgi:acyl carrier protein phosphodiesterase